MGGGTDTTKTSGLSLAVSQSRLGTGAAHQRHKARETRVLELP